MISDPSTKPPASDAEDHAEVLLRACTEENVSFSNYAVMRAVQRREQIGETPTLAGISIAVGYSYHATRHIVSRSIYLEKVDSVPVSLRLNDEGLSKLTRVSKRLARYAAESPGASPQ